MRQAAQPAQRTSTASDNYIYIEGEAVLVEPRRAPLEEIHLDSNNPRISHFVSQHPKKNRLSKEDLCKLILEQPGVSDVFKAIRDHGGLMDPILVRPDGRVIEGNCRVATFIRLNEADKGKNPRWRHILTLVIPNITDKQVAILQGQHHVSGKNKWRAYEQAAHIHKLHDEFNMDAKAIAKSLGMQERNVIQQLKAYETMNKKVLPKGGGLNKWSYVLELYKNKNLEDFRNKARNVDKFVDWVVEDRLEKGADVRELPKILKSKRAAKVLEAKGAAEAIKVVGKSDPTVNSKVFKKVKEVTALLRSMQAGKDLQRLQNEKSAQKLLKDLAAAVKDVAKAAKIKL